MGILEHELTLIGSKGRVDCIALFDSGASYSIIRRDIAEQIEIMTPLSEPEEWIFETARKGDYIQALYRTPLDFIFSDSKARFSDEFIVFDECSESIIIGAKTMQACRIKLDFDTETVIYDKKARRLRV